MTDYVKQVPQELRHKSAVSEADVHRDLPVAGPSGASTFRSQGSRSVTEGDAAFADFARGSSKAEDAKSSSPPLSDKSGSRAAQMAAASFTSDDLKPRSRDGADVVEILAGSASLDDLDDALNFLSKRQEERWKHEAHLPSETAAITLYTSEDHPYLFNLLHLPDEDAITTYLTQNTYSDDVWGLPGSLKQDLDVMKDVGSGSSSRNNALRRLTMLKQHLQLDRPQNNPARREEEEEEEEEEKKQDSRQATNGFDYKDWVRIYQS